MVDVPTVNWAALQHAYGSAENIPVLLDKARSDTRGGHVPGSTWFELWSALCHQGDTHTASYAALPFLVRIAEGANYRSQYEPLLLAASIELSRLEGNGPELSSDLVVAYNAALKRGLMLATDALKNSALDRDSQRAFRGCVAVFHGQSSIAHNILDDEDEGRGV